jgi:hypothetical protein
VFVVNKYFSIEIKYRIVQTHLEHEWAGEASANHSPSTACDQVCLYLELLAVPVVPDMLSTSFGCCPLASASACSENWGKMSSTLSFNIS